MRSAAMRIAFDLDDTIIRGRVPFPLEPRPPNPLARLFCRERIRLGCVRLMNDLHNANHEVWIYTTSFRSPFWTRLSFRAYGTRITHMINRRDHDRKMGQMNQGLKRCSKFPPAFGIDLLIDECRGVLLESQEFNFPVIQIDPHDDEWDDKIRQAVLGTS